MVIGNMQMRREIANETLQLEQKGKDLLHFNFSGYCPAHLLLLYRSYYWFFYQQIVQGYKIGMTQCLSSALDQNLSTLLLLKKPNPV